MECPHCKYKDRDIVKGELIEGDKGEFFTLSDHAAMERHNGGWNRQKVELYACPCCGKTFIDTTYL